MTVRFRGRELSHPEIGRALLERFADQIKEHGIIERAPILEGKSMFLTMASTHKPKAAEAAPSARPGSDADAAPVPAPAAAPVAPPPPATPTPQPAAPQES